MNSDENKKRVMLKYLNDNVFKYDLDYAKRNKDNAVKNAILDIQEELSKLRTSKEVINYVNFLTDMGTPSSRAFSKKLENLGIPRIEDVIDDFNETFNVD